jgi:hypothetical protein
MHAILAVPDPEMLSARPGSLRRVQRVSASRNSTSNSSLAECKKK